MIILFITAALRLATFDSPLFPSDKLCMDALRRILSAHSSRLRIHLGAEVS